MFRKTVKACVALATVPAGFGLCYYFYHHEIVGATPPLASDKDKRASCSCTCGASRIEFRNPNVLHRLECCCFSCRQRLNYTNGLKQNGSTDNGPLDVIMMDNVITAIDGIENLRPVKLRDSGNCTSIMTKCCSSMLTTTTPVYLGNVVAVALNPGICTMKCNMIEPKGRLNTSGWESDAGALKEYEGTGPVAD
eukprot:Awhi_evm1s14184